MVSVMLEEEEWSHDQKIHDENNFYYERKLKKSKKPS